MIRGQEGECRRIGGYGKGVGGWGLVGELVVYHISFQNKEKNPIEYSC